MGAARLGCSTPGSTWRTPESLALVDEWLDLSVQLQWSNPAGLWCYPIETVSQSEAGFEGVFQSSAVIPHWLVQGDESGRWEVRIRWTLDQARSQRRSSLIPEPSRHRVTAIP